MIYLQGRAFEQEGSFVVHLGRILPGEIKRRDLPMAFTDLRGRTWKRGEENEVRVWYQEAYVGHASGGPEDRKEVDSREGVPAGGEPHADGGGKSGPKGR